jgi:predicted aldo/keto reductase-like oxidoreductase
MLSETKSNLRKTQEKCFSLVICAVYGGMSEKKFKEVHADSCFQCGHCESRCPFHVKQMARMEEIGSFFNHEGWR